MDALEPKIIESGESLPVSIRPGDRLRLRNEMGADLVVIVRTSCGTEVRAEWPSGATLEIKAGTGDVSVTLERPEADSSAERAPLH